MKKCDEAAVILHYRPRIISLCKNRWPYMLIDEKVAEADYFMLCAIRTPSIGVSNFWEAFLYSFIPYMDKYYRNEGRCKFACISLDADRSKKDRDGNWTLLQCLPDTVSFESTIIIKEFVATLSRQARNILLDLIDGMPQAQIMRKHNLTSREFVQMRHELKNAYCAWCKPIPPC